jgi:hypothetical protein
MAEEFEDVPDPIAAIGVPGPLRPGALEPSLTRVTVRGRRAVALAAGLAWFFVNLAVFGVKPNLEHLPAPYLATNVVLPCLVAGVALFVGLAPGAFGLGRSVSLLSCCALAGPASFVLAVLAAPAESEFAVASTSITSMLRCFALTATWASVPLLLASVALRGAFAAAAGWRSALVGAAGGLCAGAAINLHCPNVAQAHLLLGHGVPVVAAAFTGSLLAFRTRA